MNTNDAFAGIDSDRLSRGSKNFPPAFDAGEKLDHTLHLLFVDLYHYGSRLFFPCGKTKALVRSMSIRPFPHKGFAGFTMAKDCRFGDVLYPNLYILYIYMRVWLTFKTLCRCGAPLPVSF